MCVAVRVEQALPNIAIYVYCTAACCVVHLAYGFCHSTHCLRVLIRHCEGPPNRLLESSCFKFLLDWRSLASKSALNDALPIAQPEKGIKLVVPACAACSSVFDHSMTRPSSNATLQCGQAANAHLAIVRPLQSLERCPLDLSIGPSALCSLLSCNL